MLNALKKKYIHNRMFVEKNESDKNNVSACETESFIV